MFVKYVYEYVICMYMFFVVCRLSLCLNVVVFVCVRFHMKVPFIVDMLLITYFGGICMLYSFTCALCCIYGNICVSSACWCVFLRVSFFLLPYTCSFLLFSYASCFCFCYFVCICVFLSYIRAYHFRVECVSFRPRVDAVFVVCSGCLLYSMDFVSYMY